MSNFGFLKDIKDYELFADAAIEAEKVFYTSPAMSAVGSRKALELAVKWIYAVDATMTMPYKDNLQALIHNDTFYNAVDAWTWKKLPPIIKLGNTAVHSDQAIDASEALCSLKGLFEFVEWIDYCYGENYIERHFDEKLIPIQKVEIDTKKIKEQESLLGEKDTEIQRLQEELKKMANDLMLSKLQNQQTRTFTPDDLSEYGTRKQYIDIDLKELGWQFDGPDQDVWQEYPVDTMNGIAGNTGYIDYVLFGKDGLPLAVIEAKRTSKDPNVGRKQAALYADCLERKFGRRPMMFTTNGFETYFWDDKTGPQRQVSGMFSKDDLQKLMNRREKMVDLNTIEIDDRITDRYYQKEAIRAICGNVQNGRRKNLLVMATGTGKTRTAASLTDVLSRGSYVTNVLFLADRTALVKQAKDGFRQYLPNHSLCNLCTNKDDRDARIVFSTYPTMMNAIDQYRSSEGKKVFTPAHFDLIIIDESHRSIFKKYKAIFDYFDAILVGLTATPKTDVDRNTYDFFEVEHGVPTYAYEYETAVNEDHVLVPFYNYEVTTKFIHDGISYYDLSEEDKARYEDDFAEDNYIPDFIPSSKLNKYVFNQKTVDTVIQDLMTRGIKVAGGDLLGKTIIFAQNKNHAEFIVERFNKLYPQYKGVFAQRIVCDDSYAQTIIDDFKNPEKNPRIAVSVDMMDTGIDVPECVNLVFFKQVFSKTKFWQMIGRGTRIAPGMNCLDQIDGAYTDKRRFIIFDYCNNFEFFREHKNGYESKETKTLSENIFGKKINLAIVLQDSKYAAQKYQDWRREIVEECKKQVDKLNTELISVKMQLQYVNKFRNLEIYSFINETDKGELIKYIAPLVVYEEKDEYAKRFDNFMYGLMLASVENLPGFKHAMTELQSIAQTLLKRTSIPQVNGKLTEIQKVLSESYWQANDIWQYEETRRDLRSLIQFIVDGGRKKKPIITSLTDPIVESTEGMVLDPAYNFEDYRKKVSRYIADNADNDAIRKLTHNIPLTEEDYKELERIFTEELGNKDDYQREYGNTPFGFLVRRIAKLDHTAAMDAFSDFINDESLNQQQIDFIHKIITYIENNGYMDSFVELQKPPFDKPVNFIKLFDREKRNALVNRINQITQNAMYS